MTWLDLIHAGDCLAYMRSLPEACIDSVVTDPPYGIRFMGKAWDGADIAKTHGLSSPDGRQRQRTGTAAAAGKYDLAPEAMRAFQLFSAEWATEALRVLKPGGHLVSFASCRTYHRMASGIEDAGFEIRDQIGWVFGSGFPKSHNLDGDHAGWSTALKPAWEPIAVARKPLAGTVAANMAAHGVGALNIDGCRIEISESLPTYRTPGSGTVGSGGIYGDYSGDSGPIENQHASSARHNAAGRWPANLVHDGSPEVLAAFPDAPGQLVDASSSSSSRKFQNVYGEMKRGNGRDGEASGDRRYTDAGSTPFSMTPGARRFDGGSAARFFYCAKASRAERNEGVEHLPPRALQWSSGDANPGSFQSEGTNREASNHHPTVKPIALMRWLCRLVTPSGGVVLDPFTGSGSTGVAASLEGFHFVGCELDPAYVAIARARFATARQQTSLF